LTTQVRPGEGFELLSLKLKKFMNYKKTTTFNFNTPYVVVTGPTGAGKTTILDALTFALYGRSSRLDIPTTKIEDICKKGGRVRCEFRTGHNLIQLERGRDNKGKSYLQLWINKKRYPGTIIEINEKLCSTILGMNYQAFINSTIIRQEEMKSLGSKSPVNRMKTLQNLFRLNIFEKAVELSNQELNLVIQEKRHLEGILQSKEEEFSRHGEIKKQLQDISPQRNELEKKIKDALNILNELLLEEEDMKKKNEKYQIAIERKNEAQNEIERVQIEREKAEKKLMIFKKVKKSYHELEKQLLEFQDIEDNIKSLKHQRDQHKLIQNHIHQLTRDLENQIKTIDEDLKQKKSRISSEKERIDNLKEIVDHLEAFAILNQEGRLLERIDRISLEKTWNLEDSFVLELDEEQKKSRSSLNSTLKEKDKISKDSFVLSEIKQNIIELEKEFSNIKEKKITLMKEKEYIINKEKKELENIGFSEKKLKLLKDLIEKEKTQEKIQIEFKKIETEFKNLEDPSTAINLLNEELQKKEEQLILLKDKLKDYSSFKEQFDQIFKKIIDQRNLNVKISNEIATLEERKNNLIQELEKLKLIEMEIKEIKAQLIKSQEMEDVYDKLKNDIFHTRGAPFYAIDRILPRLSQRASLILAELTDNRFSNIQLQRVESGRKGLGFEIQVYTQDGYRDVATFSGGEKTQINAALRLAISEEISVISGQGDKPEIYKKTLFIDEGDLGSLDTIQAQQAFVRKLFQLTRHFKIILITHLTNVADQFQHTITISRDSNGRSINESEL